ncbi:DUF3139 domain-containing protein [Sporosarcina sp. HYO08]|uniref:DUF3139 domain-containing protein n=1 Tax=Sporosarcina sp. HYO08 TaxID=1759557 RepID=UPI00079BAC16|nr:DUF3139 domain-containing protein [Sporosarcina sp. HYO08]KXH80880.1 hypothetical protein AU377_09110 [Sporosarcina sp. HYO08]
MRFTIVLFLIALLVLGWHGFSARGQWDLAEKEFEQYIEEQGISKSMIDQKKIKNISRDGRRLIVMVSYKDDPGFRYNYYYTKNNSRPMYLVVSEGDFDKVKVVPTEKKMKYPPLE